MGSTMLGQTRQRDPRSPSRPGGRLPPQPWLLALGPVPMVAASGCHQAASVQVWGLRPGLGVKLGAEHLLGLASPPWAVSSVNCVSTSLIVWLG